VDPNANPYPDTNPNPDGNTKLDSKPKPNPNPPHLVNASVRRLELGLVQCCTLYGNAMHIAN